MPKREAFVTPYLSDFSHPNVDNLTHSYLIISEKKGAQREAAVTALASGDLSHMLKTHTAFSDKERFKLACDMLCGLSAIHEKGLVHQDIKPRNILIYKSGGVYSSKISDCGGVKEENARRNGGTKKYLPTECLQLRNSGMGTRLEQNQDVFSMGLSIAALLNPIWLKLAKKYGIRLPEEITDRFKIPNLLSVSDIEFLIRTFEPHLEGDDLKLLRQLRRAYTLCNMMCAPLPYERPQIAAIHTQFQEIFSELPG